MGTLIKRFCPNCGYTKELCIGVGMNGLNLRLIHSVFSCHELADFDNAYDNKEILTYRLKQNIWICTKCKELGSFPELQYTKKDGTEIFIRKSCPDCGNVLNFDTNNCPKCAEIMEEVGIGMWD